MWGGVHFQKSCLKKALSRRTCLFISSPPLVHTCTHIHKAVVKTKTICYPPASNSFTDFPHSFSAVIAAKVFWHFCMAVTPARRGKKKKILPSPSTDLMSVVALGEHNCCFYGRTNQPLSLSSRRRGHPEQTAMSAFKRRLTFGCVFLLIGLGVVTFKRKEPLQKVKFIFIIHIFNLIYNSYIYTYNSLIPWVCHQPWTFSWALFYLRRVTFHFWVWLKIDLMKQLHLWLDQLILSQSSQKDFEMKKKKK